jgi:hypothetical protein
MRITRKAGLLGALTLVSAVAVAGIASAAKTATGSDSANNVTQSISAGFQKGELTTGVEISEQSSPPQKVPAASQADILYGPELKLTNKGLAQCAASSIATANTETARSTCKKSIVGTGTAAATCSPNTNPPDIPNVTVTAFNGNKGGTKRAYKPSGSLLLHTYANLGGTDQINVVPGKISKASGEFATRVRFTVPPLAGGACSFLSFDVDVEKSYKFKGDRYNYVSVKCKGGSFDAGGDFVYNSNPQGVQTLKPRVDAPC